MSAIPEKAFNASASVAETNAQETKKVAPATPSRAPLNRFLDFISSVRFGIFLLCLLGFLCFIGMIIMQQEVDGFDAYYHTLTPAQRTLYGSLGLFDIYHSWFFSLVLFVLSINIILASIDRFPKAYSFIKNPKLDAGTTWLRGQPSTADINLYANDKSEITQRVVEACRRAGMKARVTEKGNRTFVFAERGAWNRLGAYAVHVGLLTIFTGYLMTNNLGSGGQMPLSPDATSPNKQASSMMKLEFDVDKTRRVPVKLPFAVECTDIQQILIKNEGTIDPSNTIDWLTRVRITDENGSHDALIHLNNPYDYRGYRLFQASYNPVGSARNIALQMTPQDGSNVQTLNIPRGGEASLPDGTKIKYLGFYPDFVLAGATPDTRTAEYKNPAAQLRITPPNGTSLNAYAFATELPDGAPVGAPVAGYKLKLASFEKVPSEHILAVQYDPGKNVVYVGFALLILTLCAVFFFSHQRLWASIGATDREDYEVILGANTNRNQQGLSDRFARIVADLRGEKLIVNDD